MKELMTRSLAQIVNEDHRTATVFEKYDLDFCCKGKRSLREACIESGVPEPEILDQLTAVFQSEIAGGKIYPDDLSISQLIDYIISNHHSYVKKELPRILGYLNKVASKHTDRHPEIKKVEELFTEVKQEMELHMQKEEMIVFLRIQELEKQYAAGLADKRNIVYLQSPVMVLEEEHERAGDLMTQIKRLTNHYTAPPDACTTYRMVLSALEIFEIDLHRHVHLENNLLFPKALGLLKNLKVEC
jgi:regulator of cell morphogenesis and NO signaling